MNSIRARFHPRDTTGKSARVRRVTHGNKLATVLTTVQADICDGKLWAKVEGKGSAKKEEKENRPRERDKEYKANLARSTLGRKGWNPPPPRTKGQREGGPLWERVLFHELFHLSRVIPIRAGDRF